MAAAFGSRNVISDADDFNTSVKDFGNYDTAIILCELNWTSKGNSSNLQAFSGIEMVKELRRVHNLSIPILFTSFLPLNQLFNFLNVLDDNNYLPHRICIKEGFDINNIES